MKERPERKTAGFIAVMISHSNHRRLSKITTKDKIYNDVITELLDLWDYDKMRKI
jgi:hypothetical protein